MTIQEQTGLSRSHEARQSATSSDSEWTAKSLRPIARWVSVPRPDGAARLEMVWHVPDPQAADAL